MAEEQVTTDTEDTSLRESLESAFEQHSTSSSEDTPAGTPSPTPSDKAAEAPSSDAGGERPRDERGQFVKKDETGTVPPAAKQERAAPTVTTDAALPADTGQAPRTGPKPPAGWTPEARASWDKLPDNVRAEVARRETEISVAMQQSAGARQAFDTFRQVLAPYGQLVSSIYGGDAVRMIQTHAATEAVLRTGTPGERASLLAKMVKDFGIDVALLDAALVGEQPKDAPQDLVARQVREQMQPFYSFMETAQQRHNAALADAQRQGATEVDGFAADGKHPHLDVVREDMADLIEAAARRGITMSLQEAYDKSCYLHPDIRGSIIAQEAASKVQATTSAAQRAKAAASSVTGAPAPRIAADKSEDMDLRQTLEAAFDAHSGRL